MKSIISATPFLAALALAGVAAQSGASSPGPLPEGFETVSVLKTGATRDGEPITYPAAGEAEITSVIGTIEPGGRTPLHQHPVPTYVYVLEGEVELETEGGAPQVYAAGQAYIESLDRNHQLFNRSDAPARVLVVFVGAQGMPTTIAAQ